MRILTILSILIVLPAAGCSICPPGYLDDYATIGGRYQRLNPTTGRVGSAFSDPGTQTVHLDHGESVYYDADGSLQSQDYYGPDYSETIHDAYGTPYEVQQLPPGESVLLPEQSSPPRFEFESANGDIVPSPNNVPGSSTRTEP